MKLTDRLVQRLIASLNKLPDISKKAAERLAFHIMTAPKEEVEGLAHAILGLRAKLRLCVKCGNFSDQETCSICRDSGRDQAVIMVVEEPRDLWAIERTGQYNGLYHILQGRISPLDNVVPADLRIRQLIGRLKKERIRELVIATTPTRDGDTTANYIAEKVRPLGIPMTRLASGIPVGGDLEYADQVTLSCAIKGRVTI